MKINFVCYKMSKTIIVFLLIILVQIIFIIIGIKDLKEDKNLENIKNEVINIENSAKKNNIYEKDKRNIIQNEGLNNVMQIKENPTNQIEEYKNMPQ